MKSIAALVRRSSAATRLGCIALALLMLTAAILAGYTHQQLQGMQQESERMRAQLMVDSISQRIIHAIDLGIPLESLVGVEALFNQRLGAHAEIQSIALLQQSGKVLWYAERDGKGVRNPAGTAAESPVSIGGKTLGFVRLTLQDAGAAPYARSAAALLLAAVLLVSTLAFLAARFAEGHGILLRNHAVRIAARGIASGRYDRIVVLHSRKGFDLRAQQLGHAVRSVHETLVHVRRLISSLRQTEPQGLRREYLDRLLSDAEGSHRFGEHGIARLRVVAAEVQVFWIGLLITMSAVALLSLAQAGLPVHSAPQGSSGFAAWLPCLFFVAAGIGGWTAHWRRWPALSIALAACAAVGLLAALLAAGAFQGISAVHALCGVAIWCGAFAGAALVACSMVEQVPSRSGFRHAMPRWRAASLGSWLCATVWLGPELGTVAFAALGGVYGAVGLGLPVGCAGFLLLRWNGPRSLWRHRVGERTGSAHGFTVQRLGPAAGMGLAAGLLAVQGMMAAAAGTRAPGLTLVACALGLGVITGLLFPVRRRTAVKGTVLAAVLLNGLLIALSLFAWWQLPLAVAAALLCAHVLAGTLLTLQRTSPLASMAWLAGNAAGALLAACMAVAGLAPAWMSLAAILASGWCWQRHQQALRMQAGGDGDAA